MECGKWQDEDWAILLYTIRQGNCILMLGPDAATEARDGQACVLTELLAQELADAINPHDLGAWNIDPRDLVQIAQYYVIKKTKAALQAKAE